MSATSSSSLTPRMTTVSILRPPKTRCAAAMPAWTASSSIEPRELDEAIRVKRIEAHRDASEARGLQRLGLIREQHAVGGEREILQAGLGRDHPHERRHIAAEQRLAAGQADLVDAEREEDVDERAGFLEMQDVLARQPDVVLLRHAVFAAEVAAVGDRQPQVAQRTSEACRSSSTEDCKSRTPPAGTVATRFVPRTGCSTGRARPSRRWDSVRQR